MSHPFTREHEKYKQNVQRMLDRYNELVDPETKQARPGVSREQIASFLEYAKRFVEMQQSLNRKCYAFNETRIKNRKEVSDHLNDLQKRWGFKISSPMLRKMFEIE